MVLFRTAVFFKSLYFTLVMHTFCSTHVTKQSFIFCHRPKYSFLKPAGSNIHNVLEQTVGFIFPIFASCCYWRWTGCSVFSYNLNLSHHKMTNFNEQPLLSVTLWNGNLHVCMCVKQTQKNHQFVPAQPVELNFLPIIYTLFLGLFILYKYFSFHINL